jgi:hypothetical protein
VQSHVQQRRLVVTQVLTQPGIHHIHGDWQSISPEAIALCESLGLIETNFSGHPEGREHFEPIMHQTLKIQTGREFHETWETLVEGLRALGPGHVRGYLEGERIPIDMALPGQVYQPGIPVPFRIHRRRLDSRRGELFREKEIHLTLDKDRSHPDLIVDLLRAGLYGAYVPKADHTALVLTMQGSRAVVDQLNELLLPYLYETGGLVGATFKDEFALRHERFGVSVEELPEVADWIEVL